MPFIYSSNSYYKKIRHSWRCLKNCTPTNVFLMDYLFFDLMLYIVSNVELQTAFMSVWLKLYL